MCMHVEECVCMYASMHRQRKHNIECEGKSVKHQIFTFVAKQANLLL